MVTRGYHGENSFELLNKDNDEAGHVLIIEAKVENKNSLLINLYYVNAESDQLSTLLDLSNDISNKSMILGGNFNLFF